MPDVGDQIRIASTKVGEAPREGVVTSVIGQLLHVRWSTGEESTIVPASGSVTVVGKLKQSGKKAAVPVKAAKAKKATKRPRR